jgi:hypothetical protein
MDSPGRSLVVLWFVGSGLRKRFPPVKASEAAAGSHVSLALVSTPTWRKALRLQEFTKGRVRGRSDRRGLASTRRQFRRKRIERIRFDSHLLSTLTGRPTASAAKSIWTMPNGCE